MEEEALQRMVAKLKVCVYVCVCVGGWVGVGVCVQAKVATKAIHICLYVSYI